jgi:hypothetical protein
VTELEKACEEIQDFVNESVDADCVTRASAQVVVIAARDSVRWAARIKKLEDRLARISAISLGREP